MNRRKRGFIDILQRYMDGASREEEREVMDSWYNSIDREDSGKQDEHTQQQLEDRIWSKVQSAKRQDHVVDLGVSRRWWGSSWMKLASAASVLLVLGFLYYVSDYGKHRYFPSALISADELATLSKIENHAAKRRLVRLSDGSRVSLEPGAIFYFPEAFGRVSRSVYLVGDGYFDIAKDPQRPFMVYTEDIVTKVVGTSFTIHKDQSGNVEVAVMTGKVIVEKSVGSKNNFEVSNNGVVLTPNKKVTFIRNAAQYVTGLVEKPVLVENVDDLAKPGAFNFEEAPLEAVVAKLEKAYGVEIKIANEAITNCPITADLPNESLFTKLEIINALLNTRSEVKGTTIFLTGGECAPFKSIHQNP
jgi:transmembrane sensor